MAARIRLVGGVVILVTLGMAHAAPAGAPGTGESLRHIVRRGQTLHGIAREYGVPVRSLAAANGIKDPSRIRAGERLVIPTLKPRPAKSIISKPSRSRVSAPAGAPGTGESLRHIVRRGQTLHGIAREYGVPVRSLAVANGIKDPSRLRAGVRLVIPTLKPRPAKSIISKPSRSRVSAPASPTVPRTSPLRAPARHFLTAPLPWPVHGPVISSFARPRRGHRHQGIDIKAAEGTPVRAVADGTVLRAEERYGSFGRLIQVQHENGMVSFYGHNKKNLVRRGQRVMAEEVIGLVGHSGNASCDHLHFELHVKGSPVDPLQELQEPVPARATASLPAPATTPAARAAEKGHP